MRSLNQGSTSSLIMSSNLATNYQSPIANSNQRLDWESKNLV